MLSRTRAVSPVRSCLRAFFATSLFLLALTFFSISGGPPTRAEVNELGGAYAGLLSHVESAAHNLRVDVCARGADCSDPAFAPESYETENYAEAPHASAHAA